MKRTFYVFTAFIVASFMAMGVIHSNQTWSDMRQQIEEKIERDLSVAEAITQGALAQKDYERIEEQVLLWGENDPHIVAFRVILNDDRPLVEFLRETQSVDILRESRTTRSPSGQNVRFEMEYDLSVHNKTVAVHTTWFFIFASCFSGLFITLLWAILQRLAIRPLQKEIIERKWAEQALRKSEERFRAIFDGSLVALWEEDYADVWNLIDALNEQDRHDFSTYLENHDEFVTEVAQTVKILNVNEAALVLFAAESRESLVGSLEQMFTDRSYEIFREMLVAMVEGASVFKGETNYRTLQGESIDTLLSIAFPSDRHQSSRVIVSIVDITEHKQLERAMRDNEARFRGMFEHMSSGVAIYQAVDDGNDFVFVDFNPAGERIEKAAREDVIGKRLLEAFPAASEIGIFEVFQRVWRTGEPESYPVTFYKDERIEGWRENYIYRLPSGEIVAIYDDLTIQKQAEQEREQAYAFLQTVIDGFPGALMVINLDYTVALANQTAHEIGERIGSDTPLLKCHCISHGSLTPCGNEQYPCPMEEVLKTKKVVMLEHIHFDAQGGEIPVEVVAAPIFNENGEITQIIETSHDITTRKQVEEERERLLAAIDQAAETIVITDLDGTIEYVNPAFETVTGYTREEAVGQNPRILKSGEHDAAFYRAMWTTLMGEGTWKGRLVNRKKDGTLYTEEATISAVKSSGGKIINYVAIKADITAELAKEARYRQTQKMESVGRLAGGVAHDFNNILQTITGFCGLILSEIDGTSTQRQDVAEIQKAAKLAGELTQQLLAFSREQPIQYAVIDLNTVLSDGEKMLRQVLDESFQLQLELEPRLKAVGADTSQVLQIAMNLIVNARDAMPQGGRITLRTLNMKITEKDLSNYPTARIGQWVCFSVLDAGCGMDESQLAHLFEPFYTTKQLGKGTGLGLSVVYGIVEEHKGWVHVESKLGEGSVFKICLPVHDATEVGEGAGLTDHDEFLGKRILLVENDPVVRELTAEILQSVGYAVSVAADSSEAEMLFAEQNGEFDLVFSDIILPDRNGIELAEVFLEQNPELSVLLFSGDSDECAQAGLIRGKGFNYIRKPFNLKGLLNSVKLAITGRND